MKKITGLALYAMVLTPIYASQDPFNIDAPAANELFLLDGTQEVITPTKLRQTLHETPASVTIITREQIKALGLTSIPEILRLVPGMSLLLRTGNNAQVAYGAGAIQTTGKINLLIDNQSMYRVVNSSIEWELLPISVSDIQRIEVTRAPSGASYGVNSYQAVVNIITRNPNDATGLNAVATYGSINTRNVSSSYSAASNDFAYRIAVARDSDTGYDIGYEEGEADTSSDRRDNRDVRKAYVSTEKKFGDDRLIANFSYTDGYLAYNNSDSQRISDSDHYTEDYTVNLAYQHQFSSKHNVEFRLSTSKSKWDEDWRTCYYKILFTDEVRALYLANPDYVTVLLGGGYPTGGTAEDDQLRDAVLAKLAEMGAEAFNNVCGTINEDYEEERNVAEIQGTYIIDDLKTVYGFGLQNNKATSETFLGDEEGDNTYTETLPYAFVNTQYNISDFIINAGFMAEDHTDRSDETYISPRIGVNYRVNPSNTLRFAYSKSYRAPDIAMAYRDWDYLMTDMDSPVDGETERLFYLHVESNDNLEPEEIISKEVSWYSELPSINGYMDLKLYRLEEDNLVAGPLFFFNYDEGTRGSATREGLDLEVKGTINKSTIGFGYSKLNCETTIELDSFCAKNSGFVSHSYRFDNRYRLTNAYYASDNIAGYPYYRFDTVLSRYLNYGQTNMVLSLIARYYSDENGFVSSTGTRVINAYENSTHLFGQFEVTF